MKTTIILAALVGASSAALAASADYFLKIEGVARPSASGPIYLKVVSSGDLDGDGVPDEGIVRLNCARGKLAAAHFHYNVKSPRDSASGMASGKRTHHPVTFVKEWGPSTPQFRQIKGHWDIKKNEGARTIKDGWQMLRLADSAGVCAAATAVINTSRSNVKNN